MKRLLLALVILLFPNTVLLAENTESFDARYTALNAEADCLADQEHVIFDAIYANWLNTPDSYPYLIELPAHFFAIEVVREEIGISLRSKAIRSDSDVDYDARLEGLLNKLEKRISVFRDVVREATQFVVKNHWLADVPTFDGCATAE
jgi:hypothetical protein